MKKILLIEDDAPLSWLLVKILKSRYDVTLVNSAMHAWSLLTEKHFADLIIYSINHESEDGMEFLENIRLSGLFNDIPVIVLSGVADYELRKRCDDLGTFSYITKPFDPQSFLSDIQRGLVHKIEVVFID